MSTLENLTCRMCAQDEDPSTGVRYVDQHLSPFAYFRAAQARGLQVCLVLLPVDDEVSKTTLVLEMLFCAAVTRSPDTDTCS